MIPSNSIGQESGSLQAKQDELKKEGRNLPCTSRQWSSFRNPRIVRVSRSFGGKDRHSKVCTVRGLRDRRIRLSIPTAVELYDLQEKLGLNQPSKVVDWLLDATKDDIDKLPPLQMPPGFGQQQVFGSSGSRNLMGDLLLPYESNPYQPPMFLKNTSNLFRKQGHMTSDRDDKYDDGKFWDIDSGLRTRNKEVVSDQKGKSVEFQKVSAQSFFPIIGYSPLPTTLPLPIPYSYNHYEHSNLSLSQFGGHPQSAEPFFNPNSMSLPSSSLALPSGSHLYFCPTTLPSLFPSYSNEADNTRQSSHFQLLNTAAASKYLHHLHGNDQSQADKGVDNS